ncbi:HAMP domain-containing sensor histidine kinase [Muribaculum sp. NM65_B17]|uniref:sensor histidine kinase n=2 Tax=Muribaculum TaxID=1918540 RepID=UPI001093D4BB|nr:HAMP domain-containing sensor histidine kinase [Muribaculum sp. NM65_B17]TGY04947.1 PAS domain-containing sensor histidine kinase [Muribaculum sp. NM65_B17]THG44816.1 PAS domain-containing sensor histidine kinase [Muribaculaceae bacterium]
MIKKIVLLIGMCLLSLQLFALEGKRLLILNSYNEGAPWAQEIINPIMREVSNCDGFQAVEVVHLNSTLIHNDKDFDNMSRGIFDRFVDRKPDYLVLVGDFAFTLRDSIVERWGDVPMLLVVQSEQYGMRDYYYTYIDENEAMNPDKLYPLESIHDDYNFSIVVTPNLYKETVDMMAYMFPDMNKLVFVADALYQNRQLNQQLREYLSREYPDMDYEWLVANEENSRALQQYLNNTDHNIGMLLSTWFFERMTVHGHPQLIAGEARMISGAHRPVFGLRAAYLNYGITGGYFPSPDEMQKKIHAGLLDLISDKDMRKVPFRKVADSYPIVNYNHLMRDGIPESSCQPGTVFMNRPKSAWELYHTYIIAGGIVLLAIMAVIVARVMFQNRRIAMLRAHERLLNNMPVGFSQAKVVRGNDGNVVDIEYHGGNAMFRELLKRNALPGKPDKLFDADFIAKIVERLLHRRRSVRFSYNFPYTDVTYEFLISIGNEVNKVVEDVNVFAVDITEKCNAERDLQEFAHKLDVTMNVAHIIPWRWDIHKHKIMCEAMRMLRRSHYNVTAMAEDVRVINEEDYLSCIHPDDMERVCDVYRRFVEGRLEYIKMEYRFIRRKPKCDMVEWIEVCAAVTERDDNGMPTVLIGSMLLITERKRQEEMLIAARERAAEADKLKMAFLANMSHEIRTPLNAIVGFSNLLAKTVDADKKQRFINIINKNNQMLLKLIGDVLDMAKVESNTLDFNFRPTDLNHLIQEVDSTMRIKLSNDVMLNYVLGAPDCIIDTDPDRLNQVLMNLLNNAAKFTTKGSITFGYELRDDEIYFYVRDTGIGIPDQDAERLFSRFTKLNNFIPGTGLGLSISKSIVEMLGGSIGVKSAGHNRGSIFWFTIPNKQVSAMSEINEIYFREVN